MPTSPRPSLSAALSRRCRYLWLLGQRLPGFQLVRGRLGERGATTLEWALLLAAIALPSYFIIRVMLAALFAHYRLVTTINGLPFP